MSFSHKDQILWLIYITIANQDAKTRQFQKRLGTLLLNIIPIFHKRLEDVNIKDKDLKAKIYYMTLKTLLQYTYLNLLFVDFEKRSH